jgi:hypothetical protein
VKAKRFSKNVDKLIFSDDCASVLVITDKTNLYWWNISSNQWFYQLQAPSSYHQITSAQFISVSNSIIIGNISSGFLSIYKN